MFTLEVETHLSLTSGPTSSVAAAMTTTYDCHDLGENPTTTAAIQTRKDSIVEMIKSLTIQIKQMEHTLSQLMERRSIPLKQNQTAVNCPQEPIICRKCGYFAKSCAANYGQRKQGNS